jgi:dipeptidyl aminopeptidase/acylaminoacyl peptidase
MNAGRLVPSFITALVMLGATACSEPTTAEEAPPSTPPASSGPPPSSPPAPPATTASATPAPTQTAAPVHPVSLQALMQKKYDGRDLRVGRVLNRTNEYTRYFVTYLSGKLRISGILNVPTGRGPFPALVLNHGHIDISIYTNGRGLMREQDYLARHGYIVLHTDYRNHAQSSDDPRHESDMRMGYTEDVINAVHALRSSRGVPVAKDRIGMLGRSMGGGITYNALVAQPGLVKAAVVFAPVSSDAVDNFNRWIRNDDGDSSLSADIIRQYGAPEQNPGFWRNLSAVNFFDRIAEPIIIHHGTDDESCPIAWSRETLAALKRAGKTAAMYTYPGEQHAFGPDWPLSMRRTTAFLDPILQP